MKKNKQNDSFCCLFLRFYFHFSQHFLTISRMKLQQFQIFVEFKFCGILAICHPHHLLFFAPCVHLIVCCTLLCQTLPEISKHICILEFEVLCITNSVLYLCIIPLIWATHDYRFSLPPSVYNIRFNTFTPI